MNNEHIREKSSACGGKIQPSCLLLFVIMMMMFQTYLIYYSCDSVILRLLSTASDRWH